MEAISKRGVSTYIGADPSTSEWIVAVSGPVIFSNGEVVGVLRYVTSTRLMNQQILRVAGIACVALLVILAILLLSSGYFMRSIINPLQEITEKAKKIANGTYGIQLEPKYNDEIGELAQTVNEMSVKLNQNEKMQTEFISSLSHELRTPLTAIHGWSETILAGDDLDPQTRRGMKIILGETKRLTEMVVDLLDFTRIQDGRFTLNIETADILSEFEDTVYMYGSRLTQEGITLDYLPTEEEIPEIPCDPKRLRQVFLNILDNAAKHGGEGKRIEASIQMENEEIVVRIRDHGPGIPEDELPLVKKKFYKGSSKARGSGIGLAVCDEIIRLHGGEFLIGNAEGGGCVVTIRLPVEK
jgi:signal transduction histidine kinase